MAFTNSARRKTRVGILGCGGIAVSHFRAYSQFPEECEIVAVADPNQTAAQRYIEEFGGRWHADWHELLADPSIELVSICTPHHLHAPMTIEAARAGKHVICEKPMTITVGAAHEMIEAARRHRTLLSIGSERFNPRLRFIKETVLPELGAVGFSWLVSFFYRANAYYASAPWRGTWAREGGGVCANQGTHVWDQWQWLLGGVDDAYGYWANLLHPGIEVEDIAYGLVRFKNGSHGKLLIGSCCGWRPDVAGMRVEAEHGNIWANDAWMYAIDFTMNEPRLDAAMHRDLERAIDPAYQGAFQTWQVRDMLDAMAGGRPSLVPEAIDAVKILNGVLWNGWNHAGAFKDWAGQLGLPESVEAGQEQGWNGGVLIEQLAATVKDPAPTLNAPFLDR